MKRGTDAEGAAWPITGDKCRVCGWPLIKTSENNDTHPLCAEKERPS